MLELFDSLQYSAPLVAMRASPWFFPAVASVHLLGLAMLGGTVLVGDLRLLGLGLTRQPVGELARATQPWFAASLLAMLATGLLLFMCFATKYYYLAAFWVKVTCVVLAIVFTLTVRRRVVASGGTAVGRVDPAWVGATSLLLWAAIALSGRLIGFP